MNTNDTSSSFRGEAEKQANHILERIADDLGVSTFQTKLVLPGDDLTKDIEGISKRVHVGHGVQPIGGNRIVASKAGWLQFRTPNRFWVTNNQRRYVSKLGDSVIGIIVERHAEEYRVNIGGSSVAVLPTLAFDGASKRNKPDLHVGDVVYCRICLSVTCMPPELTCCAKEGERKMDWVTGKSTYGALRDGLPFQCSLGLAARLRDPESVVLNALGKHVPFEIVAGSNGMVWVHSETIASTILITNAIQNSEHLSDSQIRNMVTKLLRQERRRT